MPLGIHSSHRQILLVPGIVYLLLVVLVAVLPAIQQTRRAQPEAARWARSSLAERGRQIYRSLNCTACHTQQVRGEEGGPHGAVHPGSILPADRRFGRRASGARSYDGENPALFGTQRTGPDLANVGHRLPSAMWHHWHLFNPRAVSPGSLMPPFRFLYTTDPPEDARERESREIVLIEELQLAGGLWATEEAHALVEYLLSLRQDEAAMEWEARAAEEAR